jgi:hypothetical protein
MHTLSTPERDTDQRRPRGIGPGLLLGAVGWICLVIGIELLIF